MLFTTRPDLKQLWLATSVLITFVIVLLLNDPHLRHRLLAQHEQEKTQKDLFIEKTLNSSIGETYDAQPLTDLCAKTKWTEGLIFTCDGLEGGLGNVRNIFLNCVRYTIEAGAGFLVPEITARSNTDLAALKTDKFVDFESFFDRDHFVSSLREGCPQMRLYNSSNELWDKPSIATPLDLKPSAIAEDYINLDGYNVPSQITKWRGQFDRWLTHESAVFSKPRPSDASPLLIKVLQPFMEFPTSHDSAPFVANFGRILQFRPDIRRVAATVLHAISTRTSHNLSSIFPPTYLGVHLRTATDAQQAGWIAYREQMLCYLHQATDLNLSTIYIASGNPEDVVRFRTDARTFYSYDVVTKYDLLTGDDLADMRRLNWDQQALIDYEVMLWSTSFAGIYQSSFAWNVALRRHVASWRWDFMDGKGGQTLDDEFSWLYGPVGGWQIFAAAMWP